MIRCSPQSDQSAGAKSSRLNSATGTRPVGSAGSRSFFGSSAASGRLSTRIRNPLTGLAKTSLLNEASRVFKKFSRLSAVFGMLMLLRIAPIVLEKENLVLSRAASVTANERQESIRRAVQAGSVGGTGPICA